MKINILLLSFYLFFISNALGQTETRLSQRDLYYDYDNDGGFIIRSSESFIYFPSGKIKEEITDEYDEDGVFEKRNVIFSKYNDDESLLLGKTTRRHNLTVNLWVTISWIDFTFDANGCEVKQEHYENVGGLLRVYEYEQNVNCQITKETKWIKQPTSDTLSKSEVRIFTYFPDGISYEEEVYRIDFFSGEEVLHRRDEFQFNVNGLLEENKTIENLHLNSWNGRKRIYTYDQYENITSHINYVNNISSPDWKFNYKYVYENEYDSQGRRVKQLSERQYEDNGELVTSLDSKIVRDFEFECEDWLAEETYARVNVGVGNGARVVYHYEGVNECFEIENTVLEMVVYPNPTFGSLTISSPVFQSGNTIVSIFDMSGKLLLEKSEIRRAEKSEIDLSHLPNGMYVIQLINQEHFVQSKVVISK